MSLAEIPHRQPWGQQPTGRKACPTVGREEIGTHLTVHCRPAPEGSGDLAAAATVSGNRDLGRGWQVKCAFLPLTFHHGKVQTSGKWKCVQ